MIKIEIDPAFDKQLGKVGKALDKAAVFTLTDSATFGNQDFIAALGKKIDKPSPFTLNKSGYGVTIAKFGQANPFSENFIKPAQAAYEQFILGISLVRGLGQAGASNKNVFVPGQRPGFAAVGAYSVKPRLSAYGGLPNEWSQQLYELSLQPPSGPGARYSNGGVFWDTIKGRTGFFARPKRTLPVDDKKQTREEKRRQQNIALRQRDAHGRFIGTNRAGYQTSYQDKRGNTRTNRFKDLRVVNRGVPILLMQRETQTHHHQLIDRDAIMQAAHLRSIGMFEQRFSKFLT